MLYLVRQGQGLEGIRSGLYVYEIGEAFAGCRSGRWSDLRQGWHAGEVTLLCSVCVSLRRHLSKASGTSTSKRLDPLNPPYLPPFSLDVLPYPPLP